jgi:hypothetical protein
MFLHHRGIYNERCKKGFIKESIIMSINKKVKVLYIAGWGRSGSTLLDKVLGQIQGFFSAGELKYIWHHSLLQNTLCGCRSSFRDCEVWRNVFNEAFGGFDTVNASRMAELVHQETRSLRIPQLFWDVGSSDVSASRREFLATIEKLYLAVATTTRSSVVIDSSKNPVYASLLMLSPNIDLYIIHLVRDPRASAFSWTSPKPTKESTGHTSIEYRNPLLSSIYWNSWNVALEYIGRHQPNRYIRIRYEDLISEPYETLIQITEKLGVPLNDLPPISNGTIMMKPNHTVWGNPGRFHVGAVELRLDERWKTKMGKLSKFWVSLITWPFMIRYQYPIW